jgi:hypothetical protein
MFLFRGLSMTLDGDRVIEVSRPLFDGSYAFKRRAQVLGHEAT